MVRKIAITGPESTGKSSLARHLAAHYHTIWVPEFARTYLDELSRPYQQHDLLQIAKGQIDHENELISKANNFLFVDTEMTVIKIWSEHKYGILHKDLRSAYATNHYDLYLLMDVDLPWSYDPQRENPELGKYFFGLFEQELKLKGANYRIIRGNKAERNAMACSIIDELFLNTLPSSGK